MAKDPRRLWFACLGKNALRFQTMRFACQTRSLLGSFEQNNNSGNCTPLVGGTRFWIFQVTF